MVASWHRLAADSKVFRAIRRRANNAAVCLTCFRSLSAATIRLTDTTDRPEACATRCVGSPFRADAVHGKTWGAKDHAPVADVPGQRQGIDAASAASAKGAFWFTTYKGGLFVTFLRLRGRRKPLHLILDNLPAHKTQAGVRRQTEGQTLFALPARLRPGAEPRRVGMEPRPSAPTMPGGHYAPENLWKTASSCSSPTWLPSQT